MTAKKVIGWAIIATIAIVIVCFVMIFLGVHQAFLVLLTLCGSWLVAIMFCIAVDLIKGDL